MSLRRLLAAAGCALLLLLGLGAARAEAAAKWVVSGAGFGHGTGLSQYGAYGYAKQGVGYAAILAHYYTGTTLGTTPDTTVRVLLQSGRTVRFNGATRLRGGAGGEQDLHRQAQGQRGAPAEEGWKEARQLRAAAQRHRRHSTSTSSARAATAAPSRCGPRACRGGLNAVNAVELEDYVRGVVAEESPASWPLEALRAQAVVARSYALALQASAARLRPLRRHPQPGLWRRRRPRPAEDQPGGRGHGAPGRHLPGQGRPDLLLLHLWRIHREQREPARFGGTPIPYLRGVADPYDDESPYHRWTRKFSRRRSSRARRSGPRQAREHRRHPARRLAADRPGDAGRHGGTTQRQRAGPAGRPRPPRHLGHLQEVHAEPASRRAHRSGRAASRRDRAAAGCRGRCPGCRTRRRRRRVTVRRSAGAPSSSTSSSRSEIEQLRVLCSGPTGSA